VRPAIAGDRMVLVDRQGRQASCAGCTAVLREGMAHLLFEVNDPPGPEFVGEVVGRVLDEAGQPIRGATVLCSSAAMTADEYKKQTNERGEFQFRSLFKWSPPDQTPGFRLRITKDGLARQEVSQLFAPGADGVFRVEPLVLKAAYAAKVRVLDMDGQPVEGAWFTSAEGDHSGNKSDRDGYCTLRNLPLGSVTAGVSFGELTGSAKIEVTPASADAEPLVIKLHKQFDHPLVAPRRPAARLEIGQLAPPWSIERWTDGKAHTLGELRGRVVVIEFWEVGFSGVRDISLPVLHSLQKKFPDVAFIHIHPSGERQHFVKELLDLNKWNFVVGFDKGQGADGETQQRYGSSGGSTVILDREGRVLMNSELRGDRAAEEAKSKAIAAAAGLPWPVDKDASEEEVIRRMRRYHDQWLGAEIEKALEK